MVPSFPLLSGTDSLRLQYIKPFERQFFIGPVIKQRSVSFQLANVNDRSKKIIYFPNNAYSAGVRVNLFGIGMEGTFAVPIARKNMERYGGSEVSDFNFISFSKNWMADFSRQHYSGFYFNRSWFPLPGKAVHPQRPDLEVRNSGLSFTYIFNNRKFSMRSPYQFTEQQIRSRGSFLLGFTFSRFRLGGETEIIINNTDQVFFGDGRDARQMNLVVMGLSPGYGYNLVYKKYFLNLSVQLGPAHNWVSYQSVDGSKHYDIDLNFTASYHAAIGFNGDKYFMGLGFISRNNQARLLETQISSSGSSFRLVAGARFEERGIFKKRISDLWKKK